MREEIRNFLKIHKADIVESLTAGAVDQLLVDLSVHLNDGDRQRIECDATQKGHSWAADTLVDCLKCYDTATFTKFLQNIKKNPATKELYRELEESCVDKGLSSLLPTGNTKRKFRAFHTLHLNITSLKMHGQLNLTIAGKNDIIV